MGIKIHPREEIVKQAQIELGDVVLKTMKKLTTAEFLQVINTEFSNRIGGIAKYWIRDERHGDQNKPGGWE